MESTGAVWDPLTPWRTVENRDTVEKPWNTVELLVENRGNRGTARGKPWEPWKPLGDHRIRGIHGINMGPVESP